MIAVTFPLVSCRKARHCKITKHASKVFFFLIIFYFLNFFFSQFCKLPINSHYVDDDGYLTCSGKKPSTLKSGEL